MIYFFLCALTTLCVDANTIRVVSQTVGSDEMLLALASPDQIAALSPLAKNSVFCAADTVDRHDQRCAECCFVQDGE